jgi:hypothetical protein
MRTEHGSQATERPVRAIFLIIASHDCEAGSARYTAKQGARYSAAARIADRRVPF